MFINKSIITLMTVLLTANLGLSIYAIAQDDSGKEVQKKERRGGGKGQRFTEEQKEAFKACADELGIERPKKGERRNGENREAMKACLEGKGITMPEKGKRS